jgi:hypothetical protein
MNRISIRGVGLAAAVVATAAMSVGMTSALADTPATSSVDGVAPQPTATLDLAEQNRVSLAQARFAEARAGAAARTSRAKAARVKAAKAARVKAAQRAAATPVGPSGARALGKTLAAQRGWTGSQWTCLDALWTAESGWRVTAQNRGSGSYGIPQALPGAKMASAGPSWSTNATTQIRWGLSYVSGRYGSPCSALSFFRSHNWY